MATSSTPDPLRRVRRITTAALTAAAVGAGAAAVHLAGEGPATASAPAATSQDSAGVSTGSHAQRADGQGGFAPVAPLRGGGGAPQAGTSGS